MLNSKLMKKKIEILSFSLVIMVLGCSANHSVIYNITSIKTNNANVVVTGTVYDTNKNNRTLPGVAIKSADTSLLTTTNREGTYRLELPAGRSILRASYLGYRMSSTKVLKLKTGDSLVVDFIIKPSNERTIN